LPQGILVDIVISLGEVNESQVHLQVGVGLGPPWKLAHDKYCIDCTPATMKTTLSLMQLATHTLP
jgi:hypothetical protein